MVKTPTRIVTPRNVEYSVELCDKICSRVASGDTLLEICQEKGSPAEVVFRRWILQDRDGLAAKWDEARGLQMEHELEQILVLSKTLAMMTETTEISGSGSSGPFESTTKYTKAAIKHTELQIGVRKWRIEKIAHRLYGSKAPPIPTDEADGQAEKIVIEGGLPDDHN